jgi:diguanylate cyclase (GGDEF)-like protein
MGGLFAAASMSALNPKRNIDQYFHDAWTSQRGLPGEAVYQILQSSDGYLWLRTSAGLVRFDGVQFALMDAVIGNEPVKAIAISADGDLLIRTTSRTVLYRDGIFSDYLPPAPLPDGDIWVIFESREHQLFIGSDDFLYTARRDEIHLLKPDTSWISAFLQDEKDTIWIAGVNDLYAYQNGNLRSAVKLHAGEELLALAQDHRRTVWVGSAHGMFRLANNRVALEPVSHTAFRGGVNQIIEDKSNNMWVGTTSSGLVRMTENHLSSFKFSDGLTDNTVLGLFEDREGSLWVGTAGGVDRFRDTKVTTLTVNEGLPSNDTSSAITARDGSIYVVCAFGGLARIEDGKVVSTITKIPGLRSIHGGALYESRDGTLWLGTVGGLTRIKNGKITVYKSDPRISEKMISALSEDEEGLIAGTTELLVVRIKNGKAQPFTVHGRTTPLSSPGNYTFAIYRQASGTLWFGTVQGLFKYEPGSLPTRQPGINFPVTSVSDDGKGNLWLGGRIPGLTRFRVRDGQVTRYLGKDGLFDSYASRVLPDDEGNLWISTSNGIYRASSKDFDDFAAGRISSVPSIVFGTADGMKTSASASSEIGTGGSRAADGTLWFTTVKGIVSINPRNIPSNDLTPPVVIENLMADNLQFLPNDRILIPSSKDKIEFHYTALSLRIPERMRFKYRLDGYDRDWVDAGTRRVAYYNNLGPGTYRFRVVASNDDGLWNMEGASVGFILKPHYYQTVWFDCFCVLLLVVMIFLVFRYNTRRLRARAQELTRVVDERTKALQFQATHDSMTTFLNRRAILESMAAELARSKRDKTPMAVLLADLDHFKYINDTYGHVAGDQVLCEIARRLLESVRPYDFIGRYGGEEFLVVLSNCNSEKAIVRGEELRRAVAAAPVSITCGTIQVTMSIGVLAVEHWESTSPDEILCAVDACLYAAKDAGRNCCRTPATLQQTTAALNHRMVPIAVSALLIIDELTAPSVLVLPPPLSKPLLPCRHHDLPGYLHDPRLAFRGGEN